MDEIVKRFTFKFKEIQKEVNLGQKPPSELMNYLQMGSRAIFAMFPDQWAGLMKTLKISGKWKKIQDVSNLLNESIEEFEISSETGRIEIKLKNGRIINEPLMDVNLMILLECKLSPNSDYYPLVLGWFSQEENYVQTQLYLVSQKILA